MNMIRGLYPRMSFCTTKYDITWPGLFRTRVMLLYLILFTLDNKICGVTFQLCEIVLFFFFLNLVTIYTRLQEMTLPRWPRITWYRVPILSPRKENPREI
uniref:Uncharacterized protein n=1 Tax=Cacopsylla melanoneura TaxID=428564 RepID=A0A8D8PZ25_9HEMI